MACTRYTDAIQELVDGTLGPIRRAELEQHLEECASCRRLAADLQAIHDTAASLHPLEPPDGVWLQIAGRLRQEGRVAVPPPARASVPRHNVALFALAAVLLLAVGASFVLLLPELRRNDPAAPLASGAPAAQPGNAPAAGSVEGIEEEFRLAEQHYQNAITKLEEAARLDPGDPAASGTLDAQTAAMLQKNLQVIDQAIAESRAALRSEPQSAPARDSLFAALRRKVVLLQDTIALVNEIRKGNSAGTAQIVEGLSKS